MTLDQLKNLLIALGNTPTQDDTAKALEQALVLLIKIQQENEGTDKKHAQNDTAKALEQALEAIRLIAETTKKLQGEKGDTPTNQELTALINPLIPEPIPGKDYVLTPEDKKEIAQFIKVPIAEKIIEKIEVIKEQPIVTNEIKEVAKYQIPEQVRDSLETLTGENRLDKSAIRGLTEEIKKLSDKWEAGRPIFGPGKTRIIRIDLSAQLNGVLKTFFLGTHFGIVSVDSDSAPFGAFRETVDYNESGKNIVFTDEIDATISLASGHSLIVKVLK